MGVSEDGFVAHDSRKPEISQLHVVVGIEENIPRLEIAVQNFPARMLPSVALVQSQGQLSKDLPDLLFGQVRQIVLQVELLLSAADEGSEVTARAKFHYDV